MKKGSLKVGTRNYYKPQDRTSDSNLGGNGSAKKLQAKRKKAVKQQFVSKKEYKLPIGAKLKRNRVISEKNQNNIAKARASSNKNNGRKRLFNHVPSASNFDKNSLRAASNQTNSREKSASRRIKMTYNQNALVGGWAGNADINLATLQNTRNVDAKFTRSRIPSKIPKISRHSEANTAYSSKNKRRDGNSMDKKLIPIQYERSNTQGRLKQNLFSPKEKTIKQGIDSDRSFNSSLVKANNEISILRDELKKKNSELMKLKKFRKFPDKCKTPMSQVEGQSPKKGFTAGRKRRTHSRLTTGNKRNVNLDSERSNSQSDDYYETAKVSSQSSYSNSIYSKGITKIKSSQSCRNIEQENVAPSFHNHNNLCAVKESEEEQMTETFTKLNKKFSQPQQKEIGKKNTPRQNAKIVDGVSKSSSKKLQYEGSQTSYKSKQNSKGGSSARGNNTTKAKRKSEDGSNPPKMKRNINLPSIKKKGEIKFDHSLVGFATRSLSKKGTLTIQKAKLSSSKGGAKNDNLNSSQKSGLINVSKKYQYRGKRLNIDAQSIASSGKSQMTTESLKNHQNFHTKSGPIQTQEILQTKSNNENNLKQGRKLKLMDYRLKGMTSPSNTGKAPPSIGFNTNNDFSSTVQKSTSRVLTSRQASSRGSLKPIVQSKSKKGPKLAKTTVKVAKSKPSEKKEDKEIIQKRLALLNFDEENGQIDNERELKKKEAKAQLNISESMAKSQEGQDELDKKEESTKDNVKNKILSIDSKLSGSMFKDNAKEEEDEDHEYMLLQPTHYMLEHPMYQETKQEETKEVEEHKEDDLVHCFMDKKDRKKKEHKLNLKFEAEDMCNLQDSHSSVALNKTLEFKPMKPVHGSL
ncbi:unnamed protein product [Moneuplotes crassus]|uniref:Uncharacterized protein n=1 Tax=Euplotes crassus TaxID=5936 RepID=A0AAD1Y4C5_EUPCR|nr:unnamed protein product [Moneuplotes crassus]